MLILVWINYAWECVRVKALEETAEKRLKGWPVLITKDTSDSNKTDKPWGMHCFHED